MTSDGMLSCYTPFLLAIVRRRATDSVAREPPTAERAETLGSSVPINKNIDGGDGSGGCEGDDINTIDEKAQGGVNGRNKGVGGKIDRGAGILVSSCPPTLCIEALWALSKYAVLSPGLAVAEVLPLAKQLADDTFEDPQVIFHYLSFTVCKSLFNLFF